MKDIELRKSAPAPPGFATNYFPKPMLLGINRQVTAIIAGEIDLESLASEHGLNPNIGGVYLFDGAD